MVSAIVLCTKERVFGLVQGECNVDRGQNACLIKDQQLRLLTKQTLADVKRTIVWYKLVVIGEDQKGKYYN